MLLQETQTTICNKALELLGEEPINSLDDLTTKQARVCKTHYFLALRSVLEEGHWPFSITEEPVQRIDIPEYTKEQKYVYRIPTDCALIIGLSKRYNRKSMHKHIDWDIRYIPEIKTSAIICNLDSKANDEPGESTEPIYQDEQILIEYVNDTQQVMSFSAAFIRCVVAQLAADICMAITHDMQRFGAMTQFATQLKQQALRQALNEDGQDKVCWVDPITASREGRFI